MQNEQVIDGVTYLVTYVKKEEKKQSKRGNGIWFINTDGDILREEEEATDKYKPFCYPTELEAIKARDKQLALYRIKTYAEEQWGEFIPDRDDPKQIKHFIACGVEKKEYLISFISYIQSLHLFYLETGQHCEEIIEKFKDDLDILFDRKG